MSSFSGVWRYLLIAFWLPACAGGAGQGESGVDDDVMDPASADPSLPPGSSAGAPDGMMTEAGSGPLGSGSPEDPTMGLDDLDPGAPDMMDPTAVVGDGLAVDGTCYAACELGAATDPDAMGATDGWGWENEQSCIVPDSSVALAAVPCDISMLPPVIPVIPPGGEAIRPEGNLSTGFFVSRGRLYDAVGNDFVMRGVNNPLVWFQQRNPSAARYLDRGALTWLEDIAAMGANAVRLVWETDGGNTQLLRDAIQRSIELELVPMVELHDVTGSQDAGDPARMAQYYVDNTLDILLAYEQFLLVNIANEWSGADDVYTQAYGDAINILRNAGVNHTIVIDSNEWGQRANTVLTQGKNLLDNVDPQHNLLFSVHMYESFTNEQTIRNTLRRAVELELPLIVGEFGFQHGSPTPRAIPFDALLDEANQLGIGYLAWSWTGNSGGVEYLDLVDSQTGELTEWGNDMINGPSEAILGIAGSAVPASIFVPPP